MKIIKDEQARRFAPIGNGRLEDQAEPNVRSIRRPKPEPDAFEAAQELEFTPAGNTDCTACDAEGCALCDYTGELDE